METKFLLEEGETLDDLELDELMLIQREGGYKFSTDSVLLSNYVKMKKSDVYVDLCSGSGVIAILASYKNKPKRCYAVEIQKRLADMAKRSVEFNGLNIEVLNEDLKQTPKTLGAESVDVITVNPPYNPAGKTSKSDEIAIATHEILTNLDEIFVSCSKLLKFGGKLFMVHRSDRLVDILSGLRKVSIEPKALKIVYPKQSKEPNLVLIEATKGGKPGIKIDFPLILNNEDGTETEELKQIYGRKLK